MSNGLKNVPQEAISFAKQHLKENDLLPPSLNIIYGRLKNI